ncbi:hypothetical protein [Rhizobium wuzhouense]|uniref:hypothetical protein n=1 Tax=Rhizobium wuzhouense TaxID=1986026 RepID=UPI0010579F46|nr:hypothetical protein [Rhizobium wuzhouense]
MHILDAALVHALAEATQIGAEKHTQRRRDPGIRPTAETTTIEPAKAHAADKSQKGWRRWFER